MNPSCEMALSEMTATSRVFTNHLSCVVSSCQIFYLTGGKKVDSSGQEFFPRLPQICS